MNNLDDYLSTPDELFNTNVQFWYFEFSGVKKPNTEKPFEVYAKALHEVYFFIQDNLNKPFGCIEKVKAVLSASDFNHTEKLILVDKLLGVLYHHPEQEKTQMVYLQLTDYRNDLNPYLDDPVIKNHKWHFDFEAIKTKFAGIAAPLERHKFLTNLYYDYKAQSPEISELERNYYKDIGFFEWIKAELRRCKYELNLERATTPKTETPQPGKGEAEQGQKTEKLFSVPEWATIFYYADETKLLPENHSRQARMEQFITKHGIETTPKSFKNNYHKAVRRINKKNDAQSYPYRKLELIIPFLKENYLLAVNRVKNDIEFLKDEQFED